MNSYLFWGAHFFSIAMYSCSGASDRPAFDMTASASAFVTAVEERISTTAFAGRRKLTNEELAKAAFLSCVRSKKLEDRKEGVPGSPKIQRSNGSALSAPVPIFDEDLDDCDLPTAVPGFAKPHKSEEWDYVSREEGKEMEDWQLVEDPVIVFFLKGNPPTLIDDEVRINKGVIIIGRTYSAREILETLRMRRLQDTFIFWQRNNFEILRKYAWCK